MNIVNHQPEESAKPLEERDYLPLLLLMSLFGGPLGMVVVFITRLFYHELLPGNLYFQDLGIFMLASWLVSALPAMMTGFAVMGLRLFRSIWGSAVMTVLGMLFAGVFGICLGTASLLFVVAGGGSALICSALLPKRKSSEKALA
ncbi:hypothetical protein [Neisseria sp. 83E34]|uniref:hypothetical protein n=1 Tax=Neisseria sp. 83E34 TaxID=1692264 RepID=UPI0006CEA15C|nr:hypothetical protein [Neisseria sp. 83E34]KPN72092.1 hypothetical protein AKG09_02675 [Neisseria sp. 83E34]